MAEHICRHCKHYQLDRVLSKNGRVLGHKVSACTWDTEVPLPTSITTSYAWPKNFPRRSMSPRDGLNCPCWEERHA